MEPITYVRFSKHYLFILTSDVNFHEHFQKYDNIIVYFHVHNHI